MMEINSNINADIDILKKRKEKIFSYFKKDSNLIIWLVFSLIALFGFYIRTRNLGFLKDVTNGNYLPIEPDSYVFLRYIEYIVEHGSLYAIDYMRYYPWGFQNMVDFKLLSFIIAYFYQFLHFFNSSISVGYVQAIYPPVAFVLGLIFFFLLVRKLFDYKIALLASLFLSIIPPYLYRTMSGFNDKEAMGMVLFFAALYFFISSWQEEKFKKKITFAVLAGLSTGIMGLIWGGFAFLVSMISLFTLINFIFLEFDKNRLYSYTIWYIIFYFIMIMFRDYTLNTIIGVYYNALAIFTLLTGILIYLAIKYDFKGKIEKKINLPYTISILIIILIFGVIISFVVMGKGFVFGQIGQIYDTLTSPFGNDRWQLTVAEAHQPYLIDFINNVSWKFFWIYFLGSILIVYFFLNKLDKKIRNYGIVIYTLFLAGFSFSRFSPSSKILNGENFFSLNIMYFGGIALAILSFFIYYLYTYYKDKNSFEKLKTFEWRYILVLMWLFVLLIGSRSAIRLLFIFSTIASLLAAYFCIKLFDYSLKSKKDIYKISIWIFLILILINPFVFAGNFAYGLFNKGIILEHSRISLNQARYSGPTYDQQWQIAGKWARENTKKEAVFAHWWDYGYLVQKGFERATVTDGGNAKSSLNHYMGRYGLTGQNEIEALEFFKAHNVTNYLIVSDEIGKYPALSSIGSDANWDRYSWLPPFQLDTSKTQETREYTVYLYGGVTPFDFDFKYNGELYPKGGSAIIGFFIPTKTENGTIKIEVPAAAVVNNGKQKQIPLECIFFNGEEIHFNQTGLKGCFHIFPSFDGQNVNNIGAGIYVSEKVRKTLFAQLYLFGKPGKYFKLVYSDENQMPLALYNGRLIGPLKIWEISYPDNLKVPEHYYGDVLIDPNVTSLEGRY